MEGLEGWGLVGMLPLRRVAEGEEEGSLGSWGFCFRDV